MDAGRLPGEDYLGNDVRVDMHTIAGMPPADRTLLFQRIERVRQTLLDIQDPPGELAEVVPFRARTVEERRWRDPSELMVSAYAGAIHQATSELGGLLGYSHAESIFLGSSHMSILMAPFAAGASMATLEIHRLLNELGELERAAQAVDAWCEVPGEPVIPDTSVLIHGPEIGTPDWLDLVRNHCDPARAIILNSVLDELDRLKDRGQGTTKTRARHVVKYLADKLTGAPYPVEARDWKRQVEGITLEVWLDDPRRERLPRPDDEIVEQAHLVQTSTGRRTRFITADVGQAARAKAAHLSTTLFEQ